MLCRVVNENCVPRLKTIFFLLNTTFKQQMLTYNNQAFLPQALSTGITSRINKDPDSAIIANNVPQERSAKRNAQQINYAEFDNINDDFEYEEDKSSTANAFPNASTQTNTHVQKHLLKPARIARSNEIFQDDIVTDNSGKIGSDTLVPVKLNLEYNAGASKLIDFFMWNINETLVTPDQFASLLCLELELPNLLHLEIVDSINKQVEDYQFVINSQLPLGVEYHVIIELSVNLDKKLYEDKFEWDLNQSEVTPEDFAEIIVADLGLSLEFKPAISHSLHEMTLRLKRELIEGSYNHELHKYQQLAGLIFERNIRIRTDSSIHNGNALWEPFIEILSPWEIEKREIERERNSRRLKRENMRREVDDFGGVKRRATTRRRVEELDWRI